MRKKRMSGLCLSSILVTGVLTGCGGHQRTDQPKPEIESTAIESTAIENGAIENEIKEDSNRSQEVVLGDYTGFAYSREVTEPTEEDVERTIREILSSNVEAAVIKNGTAQEGDTVNVSFSGAADGVDARELSGENVEICLGAGAYYEAFEQGMVGKETGTPFEISFTYPEDFEEKDAAGKKASFQTVINSITRYSEVPQLTDSWVKENSEFETAGDYRKGIMDGLKKQADERADSEAVYQLVSQLYNVSFAEVSDEEAAEALTDEVDTYKAAAGKMEMKYEDYVKEILGTEKEVFEENLSKYAKSSVEKEKILNEFIECENVDISDAAFQEYLDAQAAVYGYETGSELLREMEAVEYGSYIRDIFVEHRVGMKLMELNPQEKQVPNK